MGTLTVTKSGKTCQKWTTQDPHEHNNSPEEKPDEGLGDHNFCRNPDNEAGPWCYTTDPDTRWEYCDCGLFLNLKPVKVNAQKIIRILKI